MIGQQPAPIGNPPAVFADPPFPDEDVKEKGGASGPNSLSDYELVMPADAVASEYKSKVAVLNRAVQQIGMGRYQMMLFLVIGFGWASDNLWPITTSFILTPVGAEFNVTRVAYIILAQNIGLLTGAFFWGFGCDIFGRKWAFSLTLGFASVFGLVCAGAPSFAAVGVFAALWSFGVGGNLPVDSAIFLEFLPASHQYLLTVLSTYWAFAEVFAALVAWGLIGTMTCASAEGCTKSANMGWRYYLITMGGVFMILFLIRFFFPVLESPKYLMGKGRNAEAVDVVHRLAKFNGKTTDLSAEDLAKYDGESTTGTSQTGVRALAKRSLEDVSFSQITALFSTPKMVLSTSLIILIWGLIGLAFPLYNAFIPVVIKGQTDASVYITYRNTLIIAVMGVPACILGAFMVEIKGIGRKGALSAAAALTGVFLFCSTTTKNSTQLLGWQCAYRFSSTLMYAVLYTYTPEIFPTKNRGTGNALTACANRIFGIMAPIIVLFASKTTSVPVYISGALFIVAGLLALLLPLESRGKASM